jgi:hypothetical protein
LLWATLDIFLVSINKRKERLAIVCLLLMSLEIMKTFNCNRTTQSELNFSSISNSKQNYINHLNSKSLDALIEQKEQDEHRTNKQILNSNLKMSNNYEIVDYENPLVNYPRKLTIVPTGKYFLRKLYSRA